MALPIRRSPARLRQIAEEPSDPPQWQLDTGFGQLIHRASAPGRIVGELP